MVQRGVKDVIEAYCRIRAPDPAQQDAVQQIEEALGVVLPHDFREIARFFRGGDLGGVTHYDIAPQGPKSLVRKTIDARRSLHLNPQFVLLAEPPRRFVFLATDPKEPSGGTVWSFDSMDRQAIAPGFRADADIENVTEEYRFRCYAEFFGELVDTATTDRRRKEILTATPLPRHMPQLRRRWDTSEVLRICDMLKAGRSNWDQIGRIGKVEVEGQTLTDLRGITIRGPDFGHRLVGVDERPLIQNIDFSGCLVATTNGFGDVTVKNCRFVGAYMGQRVDGRFVGCDFSRMKQHNGWLKGEFVDCRFVGADLSHCIIGDTFVRCDFSAANLKAAQFHGRFEHCRWEACRIEFGTMLPPDVGRSTGRR